MEMNNILIEDYFYSGKHWQMYSFTVNRQQIFVLDLISLRDWLCVMSMHLLD